MFVFSLISNAVKIFKLAVTLNHASRASGYCRIERAYLHVKALLDMFSVSRGSFTEPNTNGHSAPMSFWYALFPLLGYALPLRPTLPLHWWLPLLEEREIRIDNFRMKLRGLGFALPSVWSSEKGWIPQGVSLQQSFSVAIVRAIANATQ